MSKDNTTEQVLKPGQKRPAYNPAGIGGFGDNPQNINAGGKPKKQQLFSYWLPFFKDLPDSEFDNYIKTRGKGNMYMAESIAYERVKQSKNDTAEYKDLADRTEGRAVNRTELTGSGGGALEVETKLSPEQQALVNEGIKDILLKVHGEQEQEKQEK